MLKLKLQYSGHLMRRTDSLERLWCWERLKAGEGDNIGWDGWMASPTWWTWVWVNSGSWWWTGRPGVLQSMGLQRVGHDWATELNWTKDVLEKEMATHSSVLAWRIPGTGKPSGLLSLGSHRVRHDWSDLAAAARMYYQLQDKINTKTRCLKKKRCEEKIQTSIITPKMYNINITRIITQINNNC